MIKLKGLSETKLLITPLEVSGCHDKAMNQCKSVHMRVWFTKDYKHKFEMILACRLWARIWSVDTAWVYQTVQNVISMPEGLLPLNMRSQLKEEKQAILYLRNGIKVPKWPVHFPLVAICTSSGSYNKVVLTAWHSMFSWAFRSEATDSSAFLIPGSCLQTESLIQKLNTKLRSAIWTQYIVTIPVHQSYKHVNHTTCQSSWASTNQNCPRVSFHLLHMRCDQ